MVRLLPLLLYYETYKKLKVYQIHVKLAFINGIFEEEFYIGQPIGFIEID